MRSLSVSAFLARLEEDPSFRESVTQCKTKEDRLQFVKDAGFDFAPEELREVLSQLSVEELDHVAGGNAPMVICTHSHDPETKRSGLR